MGELEAAASFRRIHPAAFLDRRLLDFDSRVSRFPFVDQTQADAWWDAR